MGLRLSIQTARAEGQAITIDGDPSDWEALGLRPVATDPPYNIESYHDTCADLLECWVYNDTSNLYFMIKVRGGYPSDWDNTAYLITIDADRNENTGNELGWDYSVFSKDAQAFTMVWNEEILDWDKLEDINVAAGSIGHIEFRVSLESMDLSEEIDLVYGTYDDILSEGVNSVTVNHVSVIPEFPSLLILPLFMIATLLATVIYRRKQQT